jgi:acetoin utilization protein AcuB
LTSGFLEEGYAMKIKSLMIPDPITVTEKASIEEAIETMKVNSIRHLPVVSEDNLLKGFVTLADLKVGLIPSMLSGLSLADLMIKDPITIDPNSDIEIAAQLIYKYKIGGIPVVKRGRLVGIITETDLLRAFIDMMGILSASSRIDVALGSEPGAFSKALQVVQHSGGDVISVGILTQRGRRRTYLFRLSPCKTAPIREALEKKGFKVVDAID